jgi:hypothetical protein
LQRHADRKLLVLIVWEPILPTDWRPPGDSALARISTPRTRQFWDPKHLVASHLKDLTSQKPGVYPNCCIAKGFHWDEAILFPPGATWKDAHVPLFWNGPVYKMTESLDHSLTSAK